MKKLIILLLCMSFLVMSCSAVGSIPNERFYYIDCNTNELGNIIIVIPCNYGPDCLCFNDDGISNCISSTVNGYVYSDSTFSNYLYHIRWYYLGYSSYNNSYSIYPQYRSNSNSNYSNLTVTSINDTNMNLSDSFVITTDGFLVFISLVSVSVLFFIVVRRKH